MLECTTGQFDGTIALISPTASWVVRSSSPLPRSLQADSSCRPSGNATVRSLRTRRKEDGGPGADLSLSRGADKHLPGVYAVRVTGTLPESTIEELETNGIKVHSREMDD